MVDQAIATVQAGRIFCDANIATKRIQMPPVKLFCILDRGVVCLYSTT